MITTMSSSLSSEDLRILRQVPLHEFLNLPNNGRNQKMLCPFHRERTGSFMLYADGGYHCFGCGKTGKNCIDFCMDSGMKFDEAIEEIIKFLE